MESLTKTLERSGPYDPDAMTYEDARAVARAFFVETHGYRAVPKLLTAPERQLKLGKNARPTYGLTLAAASMSGYNVCQWSTAQCRAACVLVTGGKGTLRSVRDARVKKTQFLAEHPQAFITLLASELRRAVTKHGAIDFRPNVASDLRWERIAPAILAVPGIRAYDYTKAPASQRTGSDAYRLTFSVSEVRASTREALKVIDTGRTAAVVFATPKGQPLPATWNGRPVIDGDVSDSRADDPHGVVVGLRAKGSARGAEGRGDGFVKPDIAT